MATLNISTFLTISCIILLCDLKFGNARATVSSFETNYGIFDCVDIYKQPAFDNPLLKNHKLQRWPSHLPFIHMEETPLEKEQGWVHHPINGSGIKCPEGTVPIRRTTKEDLIRRNSSIGLQGYDPFTTKSSNTYYAVWKLKKMDKPYVLARASLSIHRPNAQNGASGAQIWMYGGDGRSSNYISVGWMVDRDVYGDDATHLTLTWKGDGNTGCVNTHCRGFVQTNPDSPPGAVFGDITRPGHSVQIDLYIYRDSRSHNWWLAIEGGEPHAAIGYWPKELFSGLKDGGSHVAFGGVVRAKPPEKSPPMGSGIADKNIQHTAHFVHVKYTVEGNDTAHPRRSVLEPHVDCPEKYSVQYSYGQGSRGSALMYGGGGGC